MRGAVALRTVRSTAYGRAMPAQTYGTGGGRPMRDDPGGRALRVLGIFAHPDDETVCAGGTLARYAAEGADVRVVSLTAGGSGQIRDAEVATRATLAAAREKELRAAAEELGLAEVRC